MSKNTVTLLVAAVLLAAVYAYYFTDWITPPIIQISPQIRPMRMARGSAGVYPVTFTLDGQYKLTSVKVVPIGALATNKNALPIWHLIPGTNSMPTKGFMYGMRIPGMVPALTNARPQRLVPGIKYRLLIESGRAKGQADFSTGAVAP
jgi:hypothetical protein